MKPCTFVRALGHVSTPAGSWQPSHAILEGDPYCVVEACYRNMEEASELFGDLTHLPPEQAVQQIVQRFENRGVVVEPGDLVVFDDDDGRRCWLFRGWHLSRSKVDG